MSWFEALVLGLIQGLTEYLPVSSSGHLAIGQALFGMNDGADNLMFTVAVHVATVLSTVVILWSEIDWVLKGLFKFKMNDETKYVLNIIACSPYLYRSQLRNGISRISLSWDFNDVYILYFDGNHPYFRDGEERICLACGDYACGK